MQSAESKIKTWYNDLRIFIDFVWAVYFFFWILIRRRSPYIILEPGWYKIFIPKRNDDSVCDFEKIICDLFCFAMNISSQVNIIWWIIFFKSLFTAKVLCMQN